jgi:hypothetical protein
MINHLHDLLLMSDRISAGKKKRAGMLLMMGVSVQLSSLYSIPWVKNRCIIKNIFYIPAIKVNNTVF